MESDILRGIMNKRQTEHKKVIRKVISGKLIDTRIQQLGDWRAKVLSKIRALIKDADPEAVEEVKWIKPTNPLGTAIWSHYGAICTCEIYKNHVKMTFPNGASLDDPSGIFNSSLDAKVWRAIDVHEGDKINELALKTLIRAAVAYNRTRLSGKAPSLARGILAKTHKNGG